MPLRVDEHDVDVTGVRRENRREAVEQAGAVFGDDLYERSGFAGLGIEANLRRRGALTGLGDGRIAHETARVRLAERNTLDEILQALDLTGIELKQALGIGEIERVEHHPAGVRECLRLQDVETEAADGAGEGSEQIRAIARHD